MNRHEDLVARYQKETGRELTEETTSNYVTWLEMQVPQYELCTLSAREQEVLQLVIKGNMSKEVADKMGLALRTIDKVRENILNKTESQSMIEAIYKLRV